MHILIPTFAIDNCEYRDNSKSSEHEPYPDVMKANMIKELDKLE